MQQGREAVEVKLQGFKQDINSLIEANISVDGTVYKLWLPSLFIAFSKPKLGSIQPVDATTKTIFLNKIFSTPKDTKKIIQPIEITSQNEGEMWGESSVFSGPIKLEWKQGNKMAITASRKWIDLMSFLFLEYE